MAVAKSKRFLLMEDIANITHYRTHLFRSDERTWKEKLVRGTLLICNAKTDSVSGTKDVFSLGDHAEVVVEGISGHEKKLQEITEKEFKELLSTFVPEQRYQKYTEGRTDDQGEEQSRDNNGHKEGVELTANSWAEVNKESGGEGARASSAPRKSLHRNLKKETSFSFQEETDTDQRINDLQLHNTNLLRQLQESDHQKADLERQVAELQKRLNEENEKASGSRKQPSLRRDQITSHQRRQAEPQGQSATGNQQLVIQGLQNQLSSKNEEVAVLRNQLTAKEQQLRDLEKQTDTRGSHIDFKKLLKERDERINELEAQLKEKEELLATLKKQARARTPRLPDLQSRVPPERDPQVSGFHRELTEKNLLLTELQRQLAGKDQELNDLRNQMTARDQEVTDLVRELGESQRQVVDLQRQVTARDQRIVDLQRRLTTRDQQVIDLERQLAERDRQVADLDRKLKARNSHVDDLQRQLREKERQLASRDELVSDLQRQLIEKTQQVNDLQNQITEKDQEVVKLQGQMTARDQQRKDLHRQLTEKDKEVAELRVQLRARSQEVINLQGQLSARDQRISDLRRQLSTSNQEITDLQRQLRSLDEHVSDLERQLHARPENEPERSQSRSTLQEHDWLINRNELTLSEEELGKGAWGRVVRAKFRRSDVAVKEIFDIIRSDHVSELFEREIEMASRCRHPCLLQLIGATIDKEGLLLVTELLERSLRSLYEERPLAENEISFISLDVAQALNYLHKNRPVPIIHRDISSSNVLLWRQGDQWRAKVSDYGTANFVRQSSKNDPGAPVYSAPEASCEATDQNMSCKVDVYSFGVLFCEICISEFPNPERREQQVKKVNNDLLRALIRGCLQEEPWERPNMDEIIEELEHPVL